MRLALSCSRFFLTLTTAYVLLTALLWYAPGRDLDESLWGTAQALANEPGARTFSSYFEFTRWYASELVHGRGGTSIQFGVPVSELIAERASTTLTNAWRGFAAAWVMALTAGVAAHFWPGIGRLALGAGSVVLSLPAAFVVVALALNGVAPWVGLAVCVWPKTYAYWQTLLQMARKRAHVLALLAQGAGPWRLQWHAIWLPNTRQLFGLLAVSVPLVLGALIPVEVLCDQHGLGQLAWRAVAGRDLPLLTALTLLFTAVTSGMSLLAETAGLEAK